MSNATGVPDSFQLLFFADVEEPRQCELDCHRHFDLCRVNDSREFFRTDMRLIHDYFEHLSTSICITNEGRHAFMVNDCVKQIRWADTRESRAKAIIDLAFLEGIHLWVTDGVIQQSTPGQFYMSEALLSAVTFAGPLLLEHFPQTPYVAKKLLEQEGI